MGNRYGAITEQGDLGLGFTVLSESEQKVLNEKAEAEKEKKKKDQE